VATTVRAIDLMLPGSFGKETLSNDGMENLALGISGAATIPLTNVDHTLTTDNQGEAQHFIQILTGALTANVNVIVPNESRVYVADNRTTGAFTVTFQTAAGGGVAVDQGARTLVYCDGTTVYPVASGTGGGGGGSGAPTDAAYLVQAAHALLTGERVVTNTPTVVWDFATPGAAGATIPDGAISYAKIQDVASKRLLGRFTPTSGDTQEITLGTGLALDDAGTLTASSAGAQPLDATLTALAGQATGVNQLPYFTGTDTAAQTLLTPFARTLLDDADQTAMQTTLGIVPGTTVQPLDATLTALAGVTTGANTLPFFTGTDTASTTALTAFMRSLLDDPDAATARSTLGVTSDAATGSYDLGLTWAGTLPASQVLMRYPFPRAVDVPVGLTGSRGVSAVAATALTTLDLRKNGTSIGSVQWAAAGTTATFIMATPTSFAAGDVLTVHAPASADATLADLGLSLAGTRAVVAGEMGATTFLGLTDTDPTTYVGNALKILRANAAQTAVEFGPVLGTMAEQNAGAVAITGGAATFTGNLTDVTGATTLGSLTVNTQIQGVGIAAATDADGSAFFTNRNAGGSRAAVYCAGDAPSYFGGTVQVANAAGIQTVPTGAEAFIVSHNKAAGQHGITVRPAGGDTGALEMIFTNAAGTPVGSISSTGSATSFNTSSDQRLKHAIAPLTAALDRVRALRPISHLWNADDSYGEGFLAHELQQQIPLAVTGEPEAINDDGSIRPQQVDNSKLVPWLAAGMQELMAQVEALTARVAALEA
jgi:hypothetical protein